MNKVIASAFVIVLGLSTLASQARAAEKGKGGGHAFFTPAGDLKWTDVPDNPGVKTAVVQGDSAKGPHHSFIKLPAGFSVPLHHHSADHYVTVISGTMVFEADGQEHKLGAGSYFAYTGKEKHTTKCEAGSDCVLFLDARGKWDVVPEGKPASKM